MIKDDEQWDPYFLGSTSATRTDLLQNDEIPSEEEENPDTTSEEEYDIGDIPEDFAQFHCYTMDNGSQVCSSDPSTLEGGFMMFSRFDHIDGVQLAKDIIDRALSDADHLITNEINLKDGLIDQEEEEIEE